MSKSSSLTLRPPYQQFSLHISSMQSQNVLPFVAERICKMGKTIARLKTRPGFFAFSDGCWDMQTCTWYPYDCECGKFARTGILEPGG